VILMNLERERGLLEWGPKGGYIQVSYHEQLPNTMSYVAGTCISDDNFGIHLSQLDDTEPNLRCKLYCLDIFSDTHWPS
jgi:hypothetical protein